MCLNRTNSAHRAGAGFTLLEMLVAISIFAMLGLAANAVLSTVIKNDEVTREFSEQLKAMQKGFGALERDLGQMVARTPRLLEGGRGSTVFQTGSDMLDSESEALVFFRLGWLNPNGLLPRGSIQSVAYVVSEGNLERWYYPYPEPEFGSDPIKTIVMRDVISVEYSFYTDNNWQRKVDASQLPQAIAMEIELEGIGKIQRKFLLPQGVDLNANTSDGAGSGNDSGAGSGSNNKGPDGGQADDDNGDDNSDENGRRNR